MRADIRIGRLHIFWNLKRNDPQGNCLSIRILSKNYPGVHTTLLFWHSKPSAKPIPIKPLYTIAEGRRPWIDEVANEKRRREIAIKAFIRQQSINE